MVRSVHYDEGPAFAGLFICLSVANEKRVRENRSRFAPIFICIFVVMPFPLTLQTILLRGTQIELYVPDEEALKDAYEKRTILFPYWGKVWASAQAMAEYLILHPEYTANKTIIELGAGLGLPSLIAARNAASVLCTDYEGEAVTVAQQSALHHHIKKFSAEVLDWNAMPDHLAADVLMLSDINYEPAAFDTLMKIIMVFLQKGSTVILSTPQRLMAKDFVASLLVYCIAQEEIQIEQEGKVAIITILVLEK